MNKFMQINHKENYCMVIETILPDQEIYIAIKKEDNLDFKYLNICDYSKCDNYYNFIDPLGNYITVQSNLVIQNEDGTISLNEFVNNSFSNYNLVAGKSFNMKRQPNPCWYKTPVKEDYILMNGKWYKRA